MIAVTCTKCGWVHMGVSREYAESEVAVYMEWYAKQDEATQAENGAVDINNFEHCYMCNAHYLCMRLAKEDDCSIGSNLHPIIWGGPHIREPDISMLN